MDLKEEQAKLDKLKEAEFEKAWEEALPQLELFAKGLIGRSFVTASMRENCSFIKYTGYKIAHTTSVGFYGQWSKKRFIVLEGHFIYFRKDNSRIWAGNWDRQTYQKKAYKQFTVPTTVLEALPTCYEEVHTELVHLGRKEYENGTLPDAKGITSWYMHSMTEIPNEMFEEVYQIHQETLKKNIAFYSKWMSILKPYL